MNALLWWCLAAFAVPFLAAVLWKHLPWRVMAEVLPAPLAYFAALRIAKHAAYGEFEGTAAYDLGAKQTIEHWRQSQMAPPLVMRPRAAGFETDPAAAVRRELGGATAHADSAENHKSPASATIPSTSLRSAFMHTPATISEVLAAVAADKTGVTTADAALAAAQAADTQIKAQLATDTNALRMALQAIGPVVEANPDGTFSVLLPDGKGGYGNVLAHSASTPIPAAPAAGA